MAPTVLIQREGRIAIITIDRPGVRNAVDGPTARALERAFLDFDADDALDVAVLTGAAGSFCAGADLKAIAEHGTDAADSRANPLDADLSRTAPMGCTRLALWCDLRVAAEDATLGVFCRRWGVPLIDGGTVRLPRLIGESRALDLILTGRDVRAPEALHIGLLNRIVPRGMALEAAVQLAQQIAAHPQACLRNDRASVLAQAGRPWREAMQQEFAFGSQTLASGEATIGSRAFTQRERR